MIEVTPELEARVAALAAVPLPPKGESDPVIHTLYQRWIARAKSKGKHSTTVVFSGEAWAKVRAVARDERWSRRSDVVNEMVMAYKQLGPVEIAACDLIRKEWGPTSDAEAISLALRWMAKQTTEGGLTRIEL